MMRATDYNEGDGFNAPHISGYEILFYKILEDMDAFPESYDAATLHLFREASESTCAHWWNNVREFIDIWCERQTFIETPF
jgi:hypothetical protein